MAEILPRTLLDLPDLGGGYELRAALFKFVVPEDSVNFFQNPSAEVTNFQASTVPGFLSPDGINFISENFGPYRHAAAYGRTCIATASNDSTSQATFLVVLPDGSTEPRLSSNLVNNNLNLLSTVSMELSGIRNGDVAQISVEQPYNIDLFNRSGTFAGSFDNLNYNNTWTSAAYTLSGNKLHFTGTTGQNTAYIPQSNTTDLIGSAKIDLYGFYSGGTITSSPGLMYRYNNSTNAWLGFRIDLGGLKLMTGVVGTPGSDVTLATYAFAPVTSTKYTVEMRVTLVGANYNFLLFLNGTQVINTNISAASLATYVPFQYIGFLNAITGIVPGGTTIDFDNFFHLDPTFVFASKTVKLTPEWNRYSLTFPYIFANNPAAFPKTSGPRQVLFIRKTTLNTNAFYADAFQYENKNYATTYFDGDFGGTWDGLPNASTSTRLSVINAGGPVVSFDSLSIQVVGFTGFGMSPVANKTVVQGQSGNESYQRTTAPKAVRSIVCCLYANSLEDLMRKRRKLHAIIAPDALTNTASNIKLQLQVVDPVSGTPRGPVLEVTVKYVGGAEGNTTNDFQEKFVLQIEGYATPGISEVYSKNAILPAFLAAASTQNAWVRSNGQWNSPTAGAYNRVYIDRQGGYWFDGTRVQAPNTNYASAAVTGGSVIAALMTPNLKMYLAGSFTAPQNRFMVQASGAGAWSQVGGATWNNQIQALAVLQDGRVLVGGTFTLPVSRFGVYDPIALTTTVIGALDGGVRDIAVVPNGAGYYACGDFTIAGAPVANRVAFFNLKTGGAVALSTSAGNGLNATCRALALAPNGILYVGGDFTTAAGASISYIAAWNGSNFIQVGEGLNAPVYGLKFAPDGYLYAVGQFTATASGRALTPGIAKFNGSSWLPVDIVIRPGTGITVNSIDADARSMLLSVPTLSTSSIYTSNSILINNSGSAGVTPKVIFDNSLASAAVQMYQIYNVTTGKTLYFDYTISAGEIVTLEITPSGVKFTSSYGNQNTKLLPGSDTSTFGLTKGNNFITFTTGPQDIQFQAYMYWKNTYWSFDGGVYNVGNL